MKAAAVTDEGRPLCVPTVMDTHPERGQDAGLETMCESIRRAVAAAKLTMNDVAAIGVATPGHVGALLDACVRVGVPMESIAVHFHDTYGQALSNTLAALRRGVTTVDASAGGLGGCPFAGTSTGNLANSVAAHAARAGLDSIVLVPADLEPAKIVQTAVYGGTLVAVEGSTVLVRGLDCVDGTPLLDIKPDRCEFTPLAPPQAGDFETE